MCLPWSFFLPLLAMYQYSEKMNGLTLCDFFVAQEKGNDCKHGAGKQVLLSHMLKFYKV